MGNMKANRKFVEDEDAVSAVIGVILMVAITVAIAATVYVYVSGIIGPGTGSTPSMSLSATPTGTVCTITVGTITDATTAWADTTTSLVCITNATQLGSNRIVRNIGGDIMGGHIISLNGLVADSEYRLTVSLNSTGGTMGTVSWTQ